MATTIKKDQDERKVNKANETKDNYEYYNRTFINLIASSDQYNWSTVSDFPSDYQNDIDLCAKISGSDVRFYSIGEYNDTLKAKISDFPDLNKPSFYGITAPIIPSGVFVDILETTTHIRTPKKNGKTYIYVMCKVRVNGDNPAIINNSIKRNDTGYIWHTFHGDLGTNSTANIAYVHKPNTSGPDPKLRIQSDYYNYSIPFPTKDAPEVVINFSTKNDNNCKANCLNKVIKTNPNLFDALYTAASNSGVKEIFVYSLNYGGKGSHGQGRACDITTITTLNSRNNKVEHKYFRGYNTATNKWELEEQPEAIQNFETAFKAHSQNENIWGPWYLHYGDSAGIDNVISRSKYDALKDVRTKEKYVKEELAKCQGLSVIELAAKSKELADNYDKTELLKEIKENLEGVVLDPGDTYEKIKLHWEHRNHCHFSVI